MTLDDFLTAAGISNEAFSKRLTDLAKLMSIERSYNRASIWRYRNGKADMDADTHRLVSFLTCGRVTPNDMILRNGEVLSV
ncbi:hypothetical protein GE253_22995 [Niveispirillum sp. SYP-B3756]|uniref:hypothetical protein n=1 Tax=Niveispirillum sp. SYP-B3756 TaxID=2662178 RepID=UPI0012919FDD|nr:hypothetical protein [Niveispirillum sp. SYP-B3756]MQP68190.1 hypothetical protein [Niveispirillum sp. SYP-B3756]